MAATLRLLPSPTPRAQILALDAIFAPADDDKRLRELDARATDTSWTSSVEVSAVDGVAGAVVVGIGVAADNGVGGEEASEGGVVEPDSHEDNATQGIRAAPFAAN